MTDRPFVTARRAAEIIGVTEAGAASVTKDEQIASLAARLAEAERDAARYRWLRDDATDPEWSWLAGIVAAELDEAIDAAMRLTVSAGTSGAPEHV